MNCFELQSHCSDYLDGILNRFDKKHADEHLESCDSCGERYKHYRLILSSIASQPRSSLPIPIRKSPFAAVLPKLDVARIGRSRWERVPWYLRATVEGLGVVLLILAGVSTGPKIRKLYERHLERSLNDFSDTFDTAADTKPAQPPVLAPISHTAAEGGDDSTLVDDFSAGESDTENDEAEGGTASSSEDDSHLRVGNSEIWRFNMKTDSPYDFRPKIVQILKDLGVPSDLPGFEGTEAPGGIQFDLLVSQRIVPNLKHLLQKIAPPVPQGLQDTPMAATFTWYKNKSKRKIPAGKARVVIWLSQT